MRDNDGTPLVTTRTLGGLNIGCLNIRGGFRDRKVELVHAIRDYGLDIVAISDVRIKGTEEGVLDGYSYFLSGVKSGNANWGVGFFVKQELVNNIIHHQAVNERLMWISMRLKGISVRLVSVYSPCQGADAASLDQFYTNLGDVVCRKGSEQVILLGDFNARIGNKDSNEAFKGTVGPFGEQTLNSNGTRLLNFCSTYGLAVSNTFFRHKRIHMYTFENVSMGYLSVIDYVIVEKGMMKMIKDTRVFRGFAFDSDHYLLASRIDIEMPTPRYNKVVCRKIRVDKLRNDEIRRSFENKISEKFAGVSEQCSDIESEWRMYKRGFLSVAEECLGKGTRGGDNKKTKWWNEEIKAAVAEKKKVYRAWLQNRSEDNTQAYRVIKRKVKDLVKKAKDEDWKKFGEDLEKAGQERNKKFWTTIKNIRNGERKQTCGSILDSTGNLVVEKTQILGRWKEYFEGLFASANQVEDIVVDVGTIEEGDISMDEVFAAVYRLKIGKSAGVDEIRAEYVKCSGVNGVKWLHRIFNLAWKSGSVPGDWRNAIIAPLHKKGNRKDCGNYRGISLLSIVGKLYASIIEKRVRGMIDDVLDENQCGFRPMRGCQDQIFVLRQTIEKFYEKNKDLFLCFVDLEKAFDRVPRQKLYDILVEYGINGILLRAIKSMYVESRAAVRIDGEVSAWFEVKEGVRQGCCLSPLLFIIFMDKIVKSANINGNVDIGGVVFNCLSYADDLVLLSSVASDLQEGLENLNISCENFGMKISVGKTKVMHVGKTRKNVVCALNECNLEQVASFKYLGCTFSEDGKLDKEFAERKKSGDAVASQLRSHVFNKKELSCDTKLTIHRSIFRPTIMYGSESWTDSGYLMHDLEVADMNVLRMIAGTNRREQWENHIRNDDIREMLNVKSVEEAASESRLRWFGHVQRMDEVRLPKRILNAELPGRRGRGRPRRRYIDSVRDDVIARGLNWDEGTIGLAQNRAEWRRVVHH